MMRYLGALAYYLSLPLIYALSLLPFRLLYLLSDLMYFSVYKLIGYRTSVVRTNLKNSFPEKTEREIQHIQDQFYHYFFDLLLETLKTLTIQPATLKKRVVYGDMSVFESLYRQKKSVIVVMGHLGNWEMGGARFSQDPFHQLYVIYRPLANQHFDRLLYHMRTRLGNKLYTMKNAFRGMIRNRDKVTATAFIADQTPSYLDAYWTTFLNQDTPIFPGTAKIAKKLNYPLIYVLIKRPKRGLYEISGELLMTDPASFTENEISECHTRRLERDIRLYPHLWLWTHRRWKHKKPKD